MKKLLSFIFTVCAALFLCSCGGGQKDAKDTKSAKTTEHHHHDGHNHDGHHHHVEIKKIVITAYLEIKPEKVDKFLTDIADVITKSKAEEGNVSYNLFADLHEKNKFVFVEEWKNQAAVDTHFNTVHFKSFGTLMDEVAAAPAKIKIFEVANEK
ncbi:MAG: antibiotic biosynthesis monooxygenase [Prevotellaceae bacterium]|jgi:quinol monooxygenase YgiN|nr:antibiotic biosynthesis monooxygenase [Prevotellaceae bacterium]